MEHTESTKEQIKALRTELRNNVQERKNLQLRNAALLVKIKELKGL